MFQLDRIAASGPDLHGVAVHLSQRLGFTLSRGDSEGHLRILFDAGFLELREQGTAPWQWTQFSLYTDDILAALVALRGRGIEAAEPRPLVSAGETVGYYVTISAAPGVPAVALPLLIQHLGAVSPQGRMEPERARAAVLHGNSAVKLVETILIVPDAAPVVAFYEQLTGNEAESKFMSTSLGITGVRVPLGGGTRISIATANTGTGPAAPYCGSPRAGIFGAVIGVNSMSAAAAAIRNGAVPSYFDGDKLITSSALSGDGVLMFVPWQ